MFTDSFHDLNLFLEKQNAQTGTASRSFIKDDDAQNLSSLRLNNANNEKEMIKEHNIYKTEKHIESETSKKIKKNNLILQIQMLQKYHQISHSCSNSL